MGEANSERGCGIRGENYSGTYGGIESCTEERSRVVFVVIALLARCFAPRSLTCVVGIVSIIRTSVVEQTGNIRHIHGR